jgi:two-component system OmpR family sensor kinase
LGLAIVAEIMKAHGGSVRVDAGPNGGAVFTLVFPLAPAHAPPAVGHD